MDLYTKDHPPRGYYGLYRKTALTKMYFRRGPFAFETEEGQFQVGPDFVGYVAIDQNGYPYPVNQVEHAQTYEQESDGDDTP